MLLIRLLRDQNKGIMEAERIRKDNEFKVKTERHLKQQFLTLKLLSHCPRVVLIISVNTFEMHTRIGIVQTLQRNDRQDY